MFSGGDTQTQAQSRLTVSDGTSPGYPEGTTSSRKPHMSPADGYQSRRRTSWRMNAECTSPPTHSR
jgi:hypothetical protein